MRLCSEKELDISKTFECGQCFRWNLGADGIYRGVVAGHYAEVSTYDGSVYITSDAPDELWSEYFDLSTDYAAVSKAFTGEYLEKCTEYGSGIRILRQDGWEALCSFIISQCNNISRIKGIVERLCENFGDKLPNGEYYTFPSAHVISLLTPDDLSCIRAGYRAEYIIAAAQAVENGEIDLAALRACDYRQAIKTLRTIRGVGEKVANCVVLFGLWHMEAFPIDVWMRRALKENFPPDFKPESLGEYAGLAQQYIFFYARSMGREK